MECEALLQIVSEVKMDEVRTINSRDAWAETGGGNGGHVGRRSKRKRGSGGAVKQHHASGRRDVPHYTV